MTEDQDKMFQSVYIHIPFCSSICSYCDFCKMFYNEELVNKYLFELENEILKKYKNEKLTTIYIGGGTPSCLSINQLKQLFFITNKLKLSNNYEFTIEVNVNDITEEKLKLFKENHINRLSIGIETTSKKHLTFLNRIHTKENIVERINLTKSYFDNISVDLMYGFPNQTIEELKYDLDFIKNLNVNHISIYSLIIEENTKIYIDKVKPIDETIEEEMYYFIIKYLKNLGYNHYEISNFSKLNYESNHNLVYWNNEEYYGFGLGASGYTDNIRYTNTRSINKYLNGNHIIEESNISKKIQMENQMILGLRKIEGVSKKKFKEKFSINIEEVFDIIGMEHKALIENNEEFIRIPENLLYIQNSILVNFIDGGKE
jgi:putative oxygen-independent coproporphyrinogen III oxidase